MRDGEALLQGLATCGICGHKMTVAYKSNVRYLCNRLTQNFAEPMCMSLDGPSIETFVVNAFFEAIQPVQFNALEEALSQQENERIRLDKYHQQQIKQAQYQAHLARRRYEQVDPENRLVAAALEQQWEDGLRELRKVQEAYERFAHQVVKPSITPEMREKLLYLNENLPQLWSTEQLTNEQRKLLLRSLITRVILKRTTPGCIQVRIVWVSGHFSEGFVNPPIRAQDQFTNYPEMVKRIEQLWKEGYKDAQIANTLTLEGFRSARSTDVIPETVLKIRHKHGWASRLQACRTAEKVDGMWTVHGLTQELGVQRNWLYYRIRKGLLTEPDVIRMPPYGNYLIRDDAQLLERLRREAQATRSVAVNSQT